MALAYEPPPPDRTSEPGRYSAFLSYSRADTAFARRLHRKLEGYRPPRRLFTGRPAILDRSGRLKPLFRDEDELRAGSDLTTAVREALQQSEHLIVVCSPNAAASQWVGREIALFRELHGDHSILTALIAGSPADAFHPALLQDAGGLAMEPLAADFRPGPGAYHLAMLKLVAGLVDVRLDQLIQRHAQRQVRTVAGLCAAAVAGVAVAATLAGTAFVAQVNGAADRRRADGLGSFMTTDLRKRLNAAGRLDLSVAVNKAALESYRDKDLARLSADELTQRAAALHALGEDYEKSGDLVAARKQFEEAWRTTAALLAKAPDDPKRIFAHAQSEYYVGFINWRDGAADQARAGFEAYARSAQRLIRIDPASIDWRHEVAYAEANLGMVDMRHTGDAPSAERHLQAALQGKLAVLARMPADADLQGEVADAYAWLADSQRLRGDESSALANRTKERAIIEALIAGDPRNVEFLTDLLGNDLGLARIEADRRQFASALRRLDHARSDAIALTARDPDDTAVAMQAKVFALFRARTELDMGGRPALIAQALGTCAPANSAERDPELRDFCFALRARALALAGDAAAAAASRAQIRRLNDVYSRRWGLNFTYEASPVHGRQNGARG